MTNDFSLLSGDSTTWVLFESGAAAAVDLNFYEPTRGAGRPIDAYVVSECDGDFTTAARRASEVVYHKGRQVQPDLGAMVVGYDLQGEKELGAVAGESGGLAFAVALAKKIFKQNPGPVAATGDIRGSHGGGPLRPVNGIQEKIQAAGRLLPKKGWILYPRENDEEIPDSLREFLTGRGLKLRPVSSVFEALDLLFDLERARPKRSPRKLIGGLVLLLIVAASAILFFHGGFRGVDPADPVSVTKDSGEGPRKTDDPELAAADKPEASGGGEAETASPGKEVRQKAPSSTDVTFHLTGKTPLAVEIATLTAEKIADSFKATGDSFGDKRELSGSVKIIWLTEEFDDVKKAPRSMMSVVMTGVKFSIMDRACSLTDCRVTTRGEAPAAELAPAAASALAAELVAAMGECVEKQIQETNRPLSEKLPSSTNNRPKFE